MINFKAFKEVTTPFTAAAVSIIIYSVLMLYCRAAVETILWCMSFYFAEETLIELK